jgi:hypothetical protein
MVQVLVVPGLRTYYITLRTDGVLCTVSTDDAGSSIRYSFPGTFYLSSLVKILFFDVFHLHNIMIEDDEHETHQTSPSAHYFLLCQLPTIFSCISTC